MLRTETPILWQVAKPALVLPSKSRTTTPFASRQPSRQASFSDLSESGIGLSQQDPDRQSPVLIPSIEEEEEEVAEHKSKVEANTSTDNKYSFTYSISQPDAPQPEADSVLGCKRTKGSPINRHISFDFQAAVVAVFNDINQGVAPDLLNQKLLETHDLREAEDMMMAQHGVSMDDDCFAMKVSERKMSDPKDDGLAVSEAKHASTARQEEVVEDKKAEACYSPTSQSPVKVVMKDQPKVVVEPLVMAKEAAEPAVVVKKAVQPDEAMTSATAPLPLVAVKSEASPMSPALVLDMEPQPLGLWAVPVYSLEVAFLMLGFIGLLYRLFIALIMYGV